MIGAIILLNGNQNSPIEPAIKTGKVNDDHQVRELAKIAGMIFLTGFVLNLIYEIIQTELFFDFPAGRWRLFAVIHILATLGDVVYILLIYFSIAALSNNLKWFCQLNFIKVAVTVLGGFIIGVIIERRAIDAGRWSYGQWMPLIPYLKVGLMPVLQMTLFPLTTFLISRKLLAMTRGSNQP